MRGHTLRQHFALWFAALYHKSAFTSSLLPPFSLLSRFPNFNLPRVPLSQHPVCTVNMTKVQYPLSRPNTQTNSSRSQSVQPDVNQTPSRAEAVLKEPNKCTQCGTIDGSVQSKAADGSISRSDVAHIHHRHRWQMRSAMSLRIINHRHLR